MVLQSYNGKEGELRVRAQGDTSQGTLCGVVTSFSFDVASNREPVFVMGNRTFDHMKSGNLEITGTIDEMFVETTNIDADYFGKEVATASPYEFNLTADVIAEGGTPKYRAELTNLVFTDRSFEIPEDDMVTESLDFQAQDVTFTKNP